MWSILGRQKVAGVEQDYDDNHGGGSNNPFLIRLSGTPQALSTDRASDMRILSIVGRLESGTPISDYW